MYSHLPLDKRNNMPALTLGDTQIGAICREYYKDEHFSRGNDGSINLWRFYNLLTGANKSIYIDNFLDRSANIWQFTEGIKTALQNKSFSWF